MTVEFESLFDYAYKEHISKRATITFRPISWLPYNLNNIDNQGERCDLNSI